MAIPCATRFRLAALATISTLITFIPGCLEGEKNDYVKYDARTDSFQVLTIFSHIAGHNTKELEQLAHLYSVRADVIVFFELFGLNAMIRRGDHEVYYEGFDAPPLEAPESRSLSASLNSIVVKPGQFFVSKARTLSYYHEVSVPGKVLDAELDELTKPLNDRVISIVSDELRRRGDGGRTVSWDDFRLAQIAMLAKELAPPEQDTAKTQSDGGRVSERPKSGVDPDSEVRVLEEESLRRLLKQAAGREIVVTRKAATFQVAFSLSATDCQQEATLVTLMRDQALRLMRSRAVVPHKSILATVESIKAEHDLHRGLVISVNVAPYLQLGPHTEPKLRPLRESDRVMHVNTLGSIQGRGIPVSETISYDAVLRAFTGKTP